MGAVYKALDRRLGDMPVAIKEMSTNAVGPGNLEKTVESFKQEAKMLIGLRHPALPRISDFFSQGEERWYLAMDYIEGETLEAIAQRRGPVPEAEVLDWARQLCEVLDYLHNQEPPVIFRDLKPANIMLTPKGEIKLIDFGIARHFKSEQGRDTTVYGSIGFSAPEQYGEGQTDPRSDIYGLGATLHYLLTGVDPGKKPFHYTPPGELVTISSALEAAVMRAVDFDPAKRPTSAQELLKLLPQRAAPAVDSARTVLLKEPPPTLEATSQLPQAPVADQPLKPRTFGRFSRVLRWTASIAGIVLLFAAVAYGAGYWGSGGDEAGIAQQPGEPIVQAEAEDAGAETDDAALEKSNSEFVDTSSAVNVPESDGPINRPEPATPSKKAAPTVMTRAEANAGLLEAARAGDVAKVKTFLAAGADVDHGDNHGYTALIRAASEGHTEIVRILLASGADVDHRDNYGYTVLIRAAQEGHTEVVRTLLASGANVDHRGSCGRTALMNAAQEGHIEAVRILLASGANVDRRDNYGGTALTRAAFGGHIEVVRTLLVSGANVNRDGGTALMNAASEGHTEVVRTLLASGVNVNHRDNYFGGTALMSAANGGHTEVVRTLLASGADVNIRNINGWTALMCAKYHGYWDVVNLLRQAGATE
jgi:ankyrin repeat protein